jgi:hypothetical protein
MQRSEMLPLLVRGRRVGPLLALLSACLGRPLAAQTLAERFEILRRHGSVSDLQQLSRDLETGFRLTLPTVHQEVLNALPCRLTVVVQRPVNGSMQPSRVMGDAGDLADRIEPVVNDTTGVTGLRVLTRDAMPVLQGMRPGVPREELTALTFWVGRAPAASDLAARRTLLARYIERCQRYF